jgi:hypothetical protein
MKFDAKAPDRVITILLIALISLVIFLFYEWAPLAYDWVGTYRPAALKLLSGQPPYGEILFFNPPWLLLPLMPVAVLPERLSNAVWLFLNLGIYIYLGRRLGMKIPHTLLLILSYPVARSLLYGQVDGLVLLGMFLPPWLGMFLLLAKPQVGLGLAILIIVRSWKKGGWKEILKTTFPVGLAYILSVALFGLYFQAGNQTVTSVFNVSLWPYTLPVGAIALYYIFKNQSQAAALAAGPLLSPYLGVHSLTNYLLVLPANSVEFVIAVAGTWVVRFLGGY